MIRVGRRLAFGLGFGLLLGGVTALTSSQVGTRTRVVLFFCRSRRSCNSS